MQRLSMDTCPACETVNPPDARYCSDCGSPLIRRCRACAAINVRTRVACHHCGAHLVALLDLPAETVSGAAMDADGPVVPVLLKDAEAAPRADWTLSLRVDALTPQSPAAANAVPATEDATWPPVGDAEAPLQSQPGPTVPQAPAPSTPERQTTKAERRASVRRARLRRSSPAAPADPAAREVLLLEPETDSRNAMAQILEAFGFRPHVAVSVAEAEGLSVRQPFAAVLLGLGQDVNAAANLCRRLSDVPRGRPLAIVAIVAADRHTDRVRMQLAGADKMLFRPVGRGDLARVLDDCGLAMPSDPRRGASPDA